LLTNCSYHLTNRAVVQCSHCARPLCPACDHRIRGFPHCQDCIVAGVELLQQQQARAAASGPQVVRRKTSPFVALLLSLLTPGLGAAYNGQTSKALVHFTIFASFFQMATVTNGTAFFLLGMVGTWLFAAIDAVRTAQLIRAGLAPDAESDAIAKRLYGNPLAWGFVLIALGTVFLLHTLFGVQLPVKQVLPVVLVILGAYMLFDWTRNRQQKREAPYSFEHLTHRPSAIGTGTFGAEATRFGTGEVITQVSARENNIWPAGPRG
jgi:hypothetical protein